MGKNKTAEKVKAEVIPLAEAATSFRVTSDPTYKRAGETLSRLVEARKRAEEFFNPVCEATHKAHKAATAQRAEVLGPIAAAEKHLRGEIGDYAARKERAAKEESARALAAHQEQAAALESGGEIDFSMIGSPVPAVKELPTVAGLSLVDKWQYRIIDERAIPREYLAVDEAKIRGVVARLGKAAEIPGIEVYSVKVPSVRG